MTTTSKTLEMIRALAVALVTRQDAVTVRDLPREGHRIAILKVHDADYGKVIGSRGSTYQSLRLLCFKMGEFEGVETKLVVEDAESRPPQDRPKFEDAQVWDNKPLTELVTNTARAMFGDQCHVEATDVGKMTLLDVSGFPAMGEAERKAIEGALTVVFFAIGKAMGRSEVEVGLKKG